MERHPVQLADVAAESMEKEIINQKYDFIEEIIQEVLVNKSQKAERTERVDRIMTSRFLGLPIFLFIMAFVFFITFTVGDWDTLSLVLSGSRIWCQTAWKLSMRTR